MTGRPAAVGQVEALEQLGRAPLQLAAGQVVDRALELQVLAAGRLGVEAVLLPDDADRAAHALRLREHVVAGDARLAFVGPREGGEDLDRRRFAGAVRAEEREDRPLVDREVEAVERLDVRRVVLPEA